MDNSIFKKIVPHLVAIALLAAISFTFFAPYVFGGKVLQQGDNQKAEASQVEMEKFKKETGKAPLWTNAYFSGMPTVQIHQEVSGNLVKPLFSASLLGRSITAPHTEMFLAMLCMYFLLLALRIDWRIGIIGAIGFGLSSFNIDIIEAGHSTKMVALAFAPAILAGAILIFRGRHLLGGALLALFVALQVYANHYQMTYYTSMIVGILVIAKLVQAAQSKVWLSFGKSVGVLAVAYLLGVASNTSTLWPTQEYQSETIRGQSELKKRVSQKSGENGGLTKDYAFSWSLGLGESLTLMVPNACGGGVAQSATYSDLSTYKAIYQNVMQQGGSADAAAQQAGQGTWQALYTGSQPYVGVAIYYGAVIVFLFFMGLVLIKGSLKWWLAGSLVLMMSIAWGKNFFVADLMFDYFPLFNKFRAVTQALGLGQLLVVVMGMLGLQAWFGKEVDTKKKMLSLYIGTGAALLFCLIGMSPADTISKNFESIAGIIQEDRAQIARADAFRSIFLILATAGLLWTSLQGFISKPWIAIAGIGLLALGDVWMVDKRILPDSKYKTAQEDKTSSRKDNPTVADKQIAADKELDFRVLDLASGDPFQNADCSYFHKSVGGYHAAKLMRYQELIEAYLGRYDPRTQEMPQQLLRLYGMLNTKYIIKGQGAQTQAVQNPEQLGNAWFVREVKTVEDADAELATLGTLNPKETAVINKSYLAGLAGFTPVWDSTATIKMTAYNPDKLEYTYTAKTDQVAVFSEIYYPATKGWAMYLNGKPMAPFSKVNYVLRGARLPAGQNQKLEMRFEPKSYYTGETISMVASGALLLLLMGGLFLYFRKHGLPNVSHLPDFMARLVSTVKDTAKARGVVETKAPRNKK
jgi:hypothetical protein